MNQVVTYNNLLNPDDTQVLYTVARHSSEILEGVKVPEGFEIILSLNSEIMEEPFEINEGDVVNVMVVPMGGGGGKNILATIAMLAVVVAAPYAAANLIGFAGVEVSALGFYAVQAGVTIAGSLLVNAVLPTQTPSLNIDNLNTSSTYSWEESYNKMQQGQPVPKVFGTHKITPPLISKYVETIDNKQYFNGLYAVNDGEITNISSIKINDESIDRFENVTYEVRNGTLNQLLIPNFDNNRSDKAVNKKLSFASYQTTETEGNSIVSLTATLVFPRGLFYAQNDGNLGNHSVKVVLEYSSDNVNWVRFGGDTKTEGFYYKIVHDTSGESNTDRYYKYDVYNGTLLGEVYSLPSGTILYSQNYWESWYYTPTYTSPYITITDNQASTIRRSFKVEFLPESIYYIRAKFYEEPVTGTRYGSDCYLEYITEEFGDDFIYPTTALIAIRALATDQLNGSAPKITCVVIANSDNPSLVSKTILQDVGVDVSRFMSGFIAWESYCISKNLKFNGVFDSTISVRKALDLVGIIGRGSVIQFGSKFDVIIDKPDEIPVQAFTLGMGNILKDSFKQSFLPIVDRANVIELTYYDIENDYEPTIIEVSNTNYDSVAELNKASVTLIGCVSRELAYSYAKFLLNCNRYLTETVTLQADKDSLVCRYGDIVKVSHDVPQYGISGRLVSSTLTEVTLDREVTMVTGTNYAIQVRNSENFLFELPVVNTNNTTSILTFVTPIATAFEEFDNYSFGEVGKISKLFRVLKIGTSDDLTRTLTLLEYNEDVYSDSGDIEVPSVSGLGISNLRATDYIRYTKDGSIETVMQLAWNGTSLKYTVQYKKTNGDFVTAYAFDNNIDLIVDDVTYDIIITDTFGNSVSTTYSVQGKLVPPSNVTGLSYSFNQSGILLSWGNSTEIDFGFFEVRGDPLFGTDGALYKGVNNSVTVTPTENKYYYVKQCDTTGHYSEDATTVFVTLPTMTNPSNVTFQFSDTTTSMAEVTINWEDAVSVFGIDYYKVSYGSKVVSIKSSEIKVIADWEGERVFYIQAFDKFGFSSLAIMERITKFLPNPPTNFRFQVIDNNVLFYWDEPSITTLPITSYELRRGSTWASAELIGRKSGGFTTVFESVGGDFKYWIASIDSDNRYSSPISVTATVSQPPDFVLNAINTSTFTGTKNNILLEDNYLLANVDTTETWQQHFVNNGWNTIQDQINAGYPLFLQPTELNGYYEETIDTGSIYASSKISITFSGETISGTISTSCDISVSLDGISWTNFPNTFQIYATNFRYYKFKINVVATTATGLYKISNITSVLDSKLKNDGGKTVCNATDVGGTVVNFNIPFIDVTSITVTPQGTTPITAIYDFIDTLNPTSFKILLFNSSGTRVSGTASWSVKGY